MQNKWFMHSHFPLPRMRAQIEGYKTCSLLSSKCPTQILPPTDLRQIFLELNSTHYIVIFKNHIKISVQMTKIYHRQLHYKIQFKFNF